MDETILDVLERRIQLVEGHLRKSKMAVGFKGLALAALAGMVGALFFTSASRGPRNVNGGEISATKFIVVNAAGEPIATLGSWGDGAITGLTLLPGRKTKPNSNEIDPSLRATLSSLVESLAKKGGSALISTTWGSQLWVGLRQGTKGPEIGAELDGGPQNSLFVLRGEDDKDGRAATVSLTTFSGASAFVTSSAGRTVSLNASDPFGSGEAEIPGHVSVNLSDPWIEKFARRAEFTLNSDGSADLELSAESFRRQVALDVDKDGNPHLDLFDDDGKLRASLGGTDLEDDGTGGNETTTPSALTLFDKNGEVIWEAP